MNMNIGKIKKTEEGFTLVEILIALSIFAIGIMAVTAMQIMALQTNARSSRTSEGHALATEKMESLIEDLYDDIKSGGPEKAGTDDAFTVEWEVQNATPVADAKTITVTVTWDYLGKRTATLSRIRGAIYDNERNRY